MTSPILPLRAAMLARCQGDGALAALMGGRVALYDEPPRAAEPVYAVFGPAAARDASVDLCPGHEQDLEIHVWAKPGSSRTALEAASRIAELLHEAAGLALLGHRLVNLRAARVETRRDAATGLAVAAVHLRAVTEVL